MSLELLDLGALFYPCRIENNGFVVGWTLSYNGSTESGIIWNPTATGVLFPNSSMTHLTGVNDSGDSCGVRGGFSESDLAVGWPRHGILRFADGSFFDLGSIVGDTEESFSSLQEINNKGVAVGSKGNLIARNVITIDRNNLGEYSDIGKPNGWETAIGYGINDKGEIVGSGEVGGKKRLFAYTNNEFVDLGQGAYWLDKNDNDVLAVGDPTITEGGRVTGALPLGDGACEAATCSLRGGRQWTRLGLLQGATSSVACGANDLGWVVGFCRFPGRQYRPFYWHEGWGMRDITWDVQVAGWQLMVATGINDQMHIIGQATNNMGALYAIKLVPVEGPPDYGGKKPFQHILTGVIQDGGGIVLTPKGPRPVGPWGPIRDEEWDLLSQEQQDTIVATALVQMSDGLADEISRQTQRETAGVVLGRALSKMRLVE